ncbi:hypothetical protein [Maioricimonas sp. JC845]
MNWQLIWQIVLIAVLAMFAVLSVAVTILGALDIRRLLASLGEDE